MGKRHEIDLARVTIELDSPLHIGSGRGDDWFDSLFVTDANGLPTIPGTSLAGVLRSQLSDEDARELFGFQEGPKGMASPVVVSWAQIHSSDDRPVPFRMESSSIDDEFLRASIEPIVRDHVRISHLGASDAEGHGLFDECLIAAGHRFTFEIKVVGRGAEVLDRLLASLASAGTRLGGRTRRGCGAFTVRRVLRRQLDLSKPSDRDAWRKLPVGLEKPVPGGVLEDVTAERTGSPGRDTAVTAILEMKPSGFWMMGGGNVDNLPPDLVFDEKEKEPDIVPYAEPRVTWEDGRGRYEPDAPVFVVPASAMKGVVRHRTAYHLNCIRGAFADGDAVSPETADAHGHPDVQELFGRVESGEGGLAGVVYFEDTVLPTVPKHKPLDHVSLDRFTSGPMDGMLFREAPLWQSGEKWRVRVAVDTKRAIPPDARQAMALALEDLAQGRLQLGAGSGRGHGWMDPGGRVSWSDDGEWVSGANKADEGGVR